MSRQQLSKAERAEVLARTAGYCHVCGGRIAREDEITSDTTFLPSEVEAAFPEIVLRLLRLLYELVDFVELASPFLGVVRRVLKLRQFVDQIETTVVDVVPIPGNNVIQQMPGAATKIQQSAFTMWRQYPPLNARSAPKPG